MYTRFKFIILSFFAEFMFLKIKLISRLQQCCINLLRYQLNKGEQGWIWARYVFNLCIMLRFASSIWYIYNYTYISGSERRLFTTGNSGNVIDFSLLMMQSFFKKVTDYFNLSYYTLRSQLVIMTKITFKE